MKDFEHVKTQYIETEKLIPYTNNPKKHPDEQINRLASSIKNFGFNQDIVVDEDYEVIVGHGRLQAAKKLGLEKVPCKVASHLSDAEADAYRIADNETDDTGVDDEILAKELEKIQDSDAHEKFMESMDNGKVSEYLDKHIEEEDLTEPETEDPEMVETDIQEGEVFKLGRHRLMCGDATNEEHVKTLMNGEKASMVFTDPPYEFEETSFLDYCFEYAKGHIFVIHSDSNLAELITQKKKFFHSFHALSFKPRIVKKAPRREAQFMAEFRNINKTNFQAQQNGLSNLVESNRKGQDDEDFIHPHQKSVRTVSKYLKHFCRQENIILDLFAGSGSTLLAAEQTQRKAYCMELDPQYVQVIINRWEELTGKKAEPIKQ